MDTNKVWLTGLAITEPILTKISGKTDSASFILQVNESFTDANKRSKCHQNTFTVEVLGKKALVIKNTIKRGIRYNIEGFLRSEYGNSGNYTVRAFAVTEIRDHSRKFYAQGLEQAMDILRSSNSLESAQEGLLELIERYTNER